MHKKSRAKSPTPDAFPVYTAIQAAETPQTLRQLALLFLLLLILGPFVLISTPWQQNIPGTGRVIAYSPLERQQNIEAPIKGRIMAWYVQEGSQVKKGDKIVSLSDIDPEYFERLKEQKTTLNQQLEFTRSKALAYELRQLDYQNALLSTRQAAEAKIEGLKAKIEGAQRELEAAEAEKWSETLNFERQLALSEQGLTSDRKKEVATMKYRQAEADIKKNQAKIKSLRQELKQGQAERDKDLASAQATLNSATAAWQEAQSSVEKLKAELLKLESQLVRQASQDIVAPRDGVILKLHAFSDITYVKEGDILATLIPQTQERAVEIFVSGRDVPLITPGRQVRLQFEGWPALQFSGWPSVAVGTFGGEVAFVDATDDGKGNFRLVVKPSPTEPWPAPHFLRQGVRANGWILLDQVSLIYELWRQFNGFPPQIDLEPEEKAKDLNTVVKRKSK